MSDWASRLKQRFIPLAYGGYGVIAIFVGFMTFIGSVMWLITYINLEGESPFVLAEIATMLGGFVIVGLFLEKGSIKLRTQMLWVAKSSLMAAIAFVAVGLMFPGFRGMEPTSWHFYLFLCFIVASLVVALAALPLAVILLLLALPKLNLRQDE